MNYLRSITATDLKPIKMSKIDTEEINMAQHKSDEYSEKLNKMIHQPFISKNILGLSTSLFQCW